MTSVIFNECVVQSGGGVISTFETFVRVTCILEGLTRSETSSATCDVYSCCVVSYSTKGFSVNVLSVIKPRDFQSMCYQLFNHGIFNQCVVSYSPRDFQSMCCQLLNQESYLNGCVLSTSKNIVFVTNSC